MKSVPSSKPLAHGSAPHRLRLHRSQRGDTLLEALIGVLLLGLMGLGTTFVAARSVNAQRFAATQGAVVQLMRHTIEAQGIDNLCQTSSITLSLQQSIDGAHKITAVPLQVECQSVAVQVAVKNDGLYTVALPNAVQRLQLSTSASDTTLAQLLGDGAIRIAQ